MSTATSPEKATVFTMGTLDELSDLKRAVSLIVAWCKEAKKQGRKIGITAAQKGIRDNGKEIKIAELCEDGSDALEVIEAARALHELAKTARNQSGILEVRILMI